jgi:ankyrin repeat protein
MKMSKMRTFYFFILTIVILTACSDYSNNNDVSSKPGRGASPRTKESINSSDKHRRTPLHYAVLRGEEEKLSPLLAQGAEVNVKDRYGYTPLHYAVRRNHLNIVKILLSEGAQVNAVDHYECTPLHHAAAMGYLEIARYLMRKKANPFAKNKNNDAPFQLAVDEGFRQVADLLYPIYMPIKSGDLNHLKEIIMADPDLLQKKDWLGQTLLHKAFRYDRHKMIDFLISQGASRDVKDNQGHRPDYYSSDNRRKRWGINLLPVPAVDKIDGILYDHLKKYFFINVGLVADGKVVLTKSYGKGAVNKRYVYASVSKVVTGMIIMQLLADGKIKSLDDNIWEYSSKYKNCMPKTYRDCSLTIRDILLFKSGVPHNREPTWKDGKLNLKFKPGTDTLYSTPSFGILGHIIEDVTGLSFKNAVKQYIGKSVDAESFWAEETFKAPGARIYSSIRDMALFAAGMIDNKYISQKMFNDHLLQVIPGSGGLIWPFNKEGTPDLSLYASGSNGTPQAFILIKPVKKLAVAIMANTRNRHSFQLLGLAEELMTALESEVYENNKMK